MTGSYLRKELKIPDIMQLGSKDGLGNEVQRRWPKNSRIGAECLKGIQSLALVDELLK